LRKEKKNEASFSIFGDNDWCSRGSLESSKVKNLLSALLILLNLSRNIFLQEAREITKYTKDVHHSRKISHQQVNYPDTVHKLSSILTKTSLSSQQNSTQCVASDFNGRDTYKIQNQEAKTFKLKEHQEQLQSYMVEERYMNVRKRLYNRELGRKAVVNQVLNFVAVYDLAETDLFIGNFWNSSRRKILPFST
jgi:hypothetical protein